MAAEKTIRDLHTSRIGYNDTTEGKMVPFLLEIGLRSPIILGHRLMLDSLLQGASRERFGMDAPPLPIVRTEGIAHASQALAGIPDTPLVGKTTYVQSFIRVLSNDTEIVDMLVKQPTPSSMSHGSGPNANIESVYVTYNIPVLYFLGVVRDEAAIAWMRSLLLTMVHIGSQAHKGNGEVEYTRLQELTVDPAWFGIVGRIGGHMTVLRPVPKRLVSLLPRGVYGFDSAETWTYPYFPGHPRAVVEPCLVPPLVNGDYFRRDTIMDLCQG